MVAADLVRPIDYAAAPQSYLPHWSDAPASRLSDAETNGATCLTKEGGCDRFWKRQCGQRPDGRAGALNLGYDSADVLAFGSDSADVLAFGSDSADVLALGSDTSHGSDAPLLRPRFD